MSQLSTAIRQLRREMRLWEAKEDKKGSDKATDKQLNFIRSLAKKVGEKKLPSILKKAKISGGDLDAALKGIKKGDAGRLIGLLMKAAK